MIQIDMVMPIQCDCCRFCLTEYTDDNNPDSYAYCCAAERFIAHASDGTDRVVSTAIIKKQPWCPLKSQFDEEEPHVMTLEEINEEQVCWIEDLDDSTDKDLFPACMVGHGERPDGTKGMFFLASLDYPDQIDYDCDLWYDNSDYNVNYRCWNVMPDEKRRAETPWE